MLAFQVHVPFWKPGREKTSAAMQTAVCSSNWVQRFTFWPGADAARSAHADSAQGPRSGRRALMSEGILTDGRSLFTPYAKRIDCSCSGRENHLPLIVFLRYDSVLHIKQTDHLNPDSCNNAHTHTHTQMQLTYMHLGCMSLVFPQRYSAN